VPQTLVQKIQVAQPAGQKQNANGQELLVQLMHAMLTMTKQNVQLQQDVLGLIANALLLVLLLQLQHCVGRITNVFGILLLPNVVMIHVKLTILTPNVPLAQSASGMPRLPQNVIMTNVSLKTKLVALQM
jgi:hypothetical protein